MSEPTKVMICSCKSDYQDETYGKSKRVFNRMNKDKINIQYRCTVCEKEKGGV